MLMGMKDVKSRAKTKIKMVAIDVISKLPNITELLTDLDLTEVMDVIMSPLVKAVNSLQCQTRDVMEEGNTTLLTILLPKKVDGSKVSLHKTKTDPEAQND